MSADLSFSSPPSDADGQAYGCSREEAMRLNDGLPLRDPSGKAKKYRYQRKSAKRRGIAWQFTFKEWIQCWDDSGKWEQRGTSSGQYVMARFGDVGPYSPENVEIITTTQNALDCLRNKPRPLVVPPKLPSLGRSKTGWTLHPRHKPTPYRAKCCGVIVGWFATPDEAASAYWAAVAARRAELLEAA